MNETFMKEKPVVPLLASMALPMVLSMLVNALYNIVDSYFVAKISEEAMTALSLVFPIQNMINAIAIGFGVGINALISLHLGAQQKKQADTAATHGMMFSILHGIIITIVSILIIPGFLARFTEDETVISLGIRYSNIVFGFSVILMISLAYEKIFQAVGRMKVSMISLLVGCISNIILDPLLIFGIGFFPEMGISGAALATGIGQTLPVVVYLIIYKRHPLPVRITKECIRPDKNLDKKLYLIGIPSILNMALPSFLISFLNNLLAAYSQSYVVVLGIYYKLQTFLYLPASGIIQGMRPLIGYNYGAGEKERVKKIFKVTLYANFAIMAVGTVICLTASEPLIRMFATNEDTIALGKTALRIISAGFIVSAVSVTCSGALEGMGKGNQSLILSLMRYIVVIIPAAWILCHVAGAGAVWNAFWIAELATALVAVCGIRYYKTRLLERV